MAAGDFIRFSGPVDSKAAATSLAIPVNVLGHAAGNTVIVFASHTSAGALSGVTDSKGNTYTQAVLENTGTPRAGIWFSVLGTALVSGDTITVSYSATQNRGQVHIAAEFEGVATFDSPGVEAQATSGTLSSGNKTPAAAPAVGMGWLLATGEMTDLTETGSWVEIAAGNSGVAGSDATNIRALAMYQALATTAAVAATGTVTSTPWAAQIAVFTFASPIDVDVLPAIEVETAQPITPLINREVAVGTATEVELGQVIDPQLDRTVDVGTATEVEIGQPFGVLINRNIDVGTATEVELGLTITPEIAGPPGCGEDVVGWQMAEGRPFGWTSWGTFGPGFLHVYVCVAGPISVTVNPAIERELANPITPSVPREVAVGTATERELANQITASIDRLVAVGTAIERELANPIDPRIGRVVQIGTATEVESANPISPLLNREVIVGTATEVELGQPISPVKPILVPVQTAVERELARVMTPFLGEPFIPIVTCSTHAIGVDCEIASVGVACALLSIDVECEVVDAYGQTH